MDFLDLVPLLPPELPGPRSRKRSPGENLTGAISLVLFPCLCFLIVLFTDVGTHPITALVVVPLAFTAASFVLCRRLHLSSGSTTATTVGCAASSLLSSGMAFLLGVFASFYSGF